MSAKSKAPPAVQVESVSSAAGVLPAEGFVNRLQLTGQPARPARKKHPAQPKIPGVLPFSRATLWRMVGAGKFPKPVRLGDRVTAWRVEDVRQWMAAQQAA